MPGSRFGSSKRSVASFRLARHEALAMDDKILESDFFERDTPPSCCELLAIICNDTDATAQEVTELHDSRGESDPKDSPLIEHSVTLETQKDRRLP